MLVVLIIHVLKIMYVFMYVVTSDVQAVNATVVDESTIDIQCWFIHGSDALGCKVVLVSVCPNISDIHANLSRSDMSASGQLSLIHNISCYHRVFAFGIDVNNTVSNLTIEGIIKPTKGVVHTGNNGNNVLINLCSYSFLSGNDQLPIAVTIILSLLTVLVIIVVTSALLLIMWKISMLLITSFVEFISIFKL